MGKAGTEHAAPAWPAACFARHDQCTRRAPASERFHCHEFRVPLATRSVDTLDAAWASGLICMMAISSPQYVWTLFTKPLGGALGVTPAALQVTFSLLIVLQTFFSPFQGYLVDRFGPRRLIALGAVLTGLSWVLAAHAGSLTHAVSHLRHCRRPGHRHRLRRRRWPDGGMVSGSAGLCRRRGGGRLRHGRDRHDIPDRPFACRRRLSGDAATVRRDLRLGRLPCGTRPESATGRGQRCHGRRISRQPGTC